MTTSLQEVFLHAAELDAAALERVGAVAAFQLGCELGGLAVIMLTASRKGGEVKVSVPQALVERARLASKELGSCAFRALPLAEDPGRVQVEIGFF